MICTAVMYATYVGAVRRLSTADERFKQDAGENVAQQKRQYQLFVYDYSRALQVTDRTPPSPDVSSLIISKVA